MRTSFELRLVASTIEEARSVASKEIARFLQIEEKDLEDKVSMELKVSYPKAESISEIEQSMASQVFQITAYGTVKQSVAKPFGF